MRKPHEKANSNLTPRYVHSPGTCGKTRENTEARGRLFPPIPNCSRHRGPQRDRSKGAAVPFAPDHGHSCIRMVKTPRSRRALQRVTTRVAATLTSMSRRTRYSPHSIAPYWNARSRPVAQILPGRITGWPSECLCFLQGIGTASTSRRARAQTCGRPGLRSSRCEHLPRNAPRIATWQKSARYI